VNSVHQASERAGMPAFDDVSSRSTTIYIKESESTRFTGGKSKTGDRIGLIEWDLSEAALIATSRMTGARNHQYPSAALGLIHELGHAWQFQNGVSKTENSEPQVIFSVEKQWADYYGEPVRTPVRPHGGVGVENKPTFWFSR